ncbi:uncharacterized protein KLLA0_F19470g [Kluyveromyces lactis]|uniref:KLLA0F19470p n=1 Tax=Kluyveromyces lactis (strain ATCC 8585 / CBS 2359 / DSM 70799 / NBRC 1267 / NRRL Y-1140 / WM37) TaxID=284590 RepID=Q6CJD5_KLULA|nr:uncharacterized protein KLLA0_F19470g [Kluyveromyces lactis]CAG98662.1 KLLA0F19470p [Kluyveromyces lactis]|eukprot:XP_455954.1 uncharacterized protein KLLA0_F19470g [Kluyveromyces lactis]
MRPTQIRLIKVNPDKIRRVAVIGAGPVGSGLTKALLNEKHFESVKVFEKRSNFGGLWNYTKPLLKDSNVTSSPSVPCEYPHIRIQPQPHPEETHVFQTAVYKYLDTNVPKTLMEYKGHRFPTDTPLFPVREQVLDYIMKYSKPIEKYVTFNSEIVKVSYEDATAEYSVKAQNLLSKEITEEKFDAVAVATGFYDLPFIPSRPGLKEWNVKYPCSVSHAKDFDCPEDFHGVEGEILIVGNSASGADLAFELANELQKPIYKSKRSESKLPAPFDPFIKDVPDIREFNPSTKSITFVDGTELKNVEKVIFCTGYLKSLPFLPQNESGVGNSILNNLIGDGRRVQNLYNHILPISLPTFGIIGLPRFVLPTRLSETQGAWLSRVWSGRIQLPSEELQQKYHDWFIEKSGDGSKYHDLAFPWDVQYSQRLNREIRHAGNGGYFGVEWKGDQIRARSAINAIKEGYVAYYKATGTKAKTLDELLESGYLKWPEDSKSCVQIPTFVP